MTLTSVSITLTSMSVTSTTVNDFDLCVSDLDLFVSEIKLSVNECDYFSWTEVSGFSLIFLSLKKKIINFNFFSLVHSFSIVQSLSAAFSLHLSTSTGFKSLFMTLVKYCTLTVSMFGC